MNFLFGNIFGELCLKMERICSEFVDRKKSFKKIFFDPIRWKRNFAYVKNENKNKKKEKIE